MTTTAITWDLTPVAVYVPMNRWGIDHWTTLAYLETRTVDHHGMLNHDQMRCDRGRHQMFYAAKLQVLAGLGTYADGAGYPTRLKTPEPGPGGTWGKVDLPGHDDYDCLADIIHTGLALPVMPQPREPHRDMFLDAYGRQVKAIDGGLIAPSFVTGMTELWLMTKASYTLTSQGQAIAAELRAHLAATRHSHQFMPACLTAAQQGSDA